MVDVIRSRRGYPDNNHNHWVVASDLEFNKGWPQLGCIQLFCGYGNWKQAADLKELMQRLQLFRILISTSLFRLAHPHK